MTSFNWNVIRIDKVDYVTLKDARWLEQSIKKAHRQSDQQVNAIQTDTLEEVAKFVEMQEGQCFDPKVMAAAIRGNLKYGDHFSFFAAALREGKS